MKVLFLERIEEGKQNSILDLEIYPTLILNLFFFFYPFEKIDLHILLKWTLSSVKLKFHNVFLKGLGFTLRGKRSHLK